MMKKFLLLVMAAFICSVMNAQLVTSTSFKKGKAATTWYVKAGATLANMSGDGESADALFGYNVGIAFDRTIGSGGMFWGSGLQLATKGFKYGYDDEEIKLNTNKLEIPLNLGYKFGVSDDLAIDARVGGFVNFDLFGKLTETYEGDEYSENIGDLEDYDRLSAGMQFGVGVWYQKLNFNITYQAGLLKANEMKEKNWMISVGYAF